MYSNVTYRHDTLISTCVAGTVAAPGRKVWAAIFVVVLNMNSRKLICLYSRPSENLLIHHMWTKWLMNNDLNCFYVNTSRKLCKFSMFKLKYSNISVSTQHSNSKFVL